MHDRVNIMQEPSFTVSEFVAVLNQTLDYAYPVVNVVGELTNFRVSRGKWVYFDIKDDEASVKCFGTVFQLPGPLEDGMMVHIVANPRLHPLYNFSLNLQSITPVGEGSLKRAADLLLAKLTAEGLFDPHRKRPVPFAPDHIGLITAKQSAAYADFIKILNERWSGVLVTHRDVQVQGDPAVAEIVNAIEAMNQLAHPPEVLVITRGGGSAEDLAAFNSEQVTRAVAACRIPTIVAIGHESDISLAELAADLRASTPSNAVQLLVPDKAAVLMALKEQSKGMRDILVAYMQNIHRDLKENAHTIQHMAEQAYLAAEHTLERQTDLLEALNPQKVLKRGYAVVRAISGDKFIKTVKGLKKGDDITIDWQDGSAEAIISSISSRTRI
jgi:exodeoxyribonuclease VII large subunit